MLVEYVIFFPLLSIENKFMKVTDMHLNKIITFAHVGFFFFGFFFVDWCKLLNVLLTCTAVD